MSQLAERMAALVGEEPALRSLPPGSASVFGWADLNHALDTQRLEWPRVRIVSGGSAVPETEYTTEVPRRVGSPYRAISPARLYAILRTGATLVVDGINQLHPGVDRIASALSTHFRSPVLVNLYASWGDVEGFDIHWDDHEVLVIQLDGTKDWQVFRPTRAWPLWFDVADAPPPTDDPVLAPTLKPGDLLSVPHGWWHKAVAVQSPSLHLTFGITRPTGIDYLTWIVDQLRDWEPVRQPIPFGASVADDHKRRALAAQLAAKLAATLSSPAGDLDAFLTYQDGYANPLSRFSLPGGAASPDLPAIGRLRWIAPRAVVETVSERLTVTSAGRRLTLAREAEPVIAFLMNRVETTADEVFAAAQLRPGDCRSLLTELTRHGMLQLLAD